MKVSFTLYARTHSHRYLDSPSFFIAGFDSFTNIIGLWHIMPIMDIFVSGKTKCNELMMHISNTA